MRNKNLKKNLKHTNVVCLFPIDFKIILFFKIIFYKWKANQLRKKKLLRKESINQNMKSWDQHMTKHQYDNCDR